MLSIVILTVCAQLEAGLPPPSFDLRQISSAVSTALRTQRLLVGLEA
jgi:hypothetical protein